VKGGIEVGGLRKDWSIGRARRCNLWGRMLAYVGVQGPCYYFALSMVAVPHVQQSQKHSGLIPHSAKAEKTMKRKRNREKGKMTMIEARGPIKGVVASCFLLLSSYIILGCGSNLALIFYQV
jgi:hypothetical protein